VVRFPRANKYATELERENIVEEEDSLIGFCRDVTTLVSAFLRSKWGVRCKVSGVCSRNPHSIASNLILVVCSP